MITHVIDGRAEAHEAGTYRLLPFDVPAHATSIHVRYVIGAALKDGGGIIDLGVFDARGADFMGAGFRGWSGGARSEFFISATDATPGYTAGALFAGTWHVCLGLYNIDAEGCAYRVTIEITVAEAQALTETALFPSLLALSDQPRTDRRRADGWYKGDLHCHTFHSDGDSSPEEIVAQAEALGFDFLAITDHNVLSAHSVTRGIDSPLLLIPGMEVTTNYGHWNVWGARDPLEFRVTSSDEMRRVMIAARERGDLVSCNHPRPHGPDWVFTDVDTFHCVEVWNGHWLFLNEVCLAFWEAHLRAGRRYVAVGGSDTHFTKRDHLAKLGQPTVYIHCEGDPSPAALLANLRAGHAFISESPTGARLHLSINAAIMGDVIMPRADPLTCVVRVIDGQGATVQLHNSDGLIVEQTVSSADEVHEFGLTAADRLYVRAQLVESINGVMQVRALTNPIYFASAEVESV